MPRLALKVDVDTLRGTLVGVPALVAAMRAAGAGGTFLFSLGPDRTGRAIRRVFRPGFFSKVSRTSVLEHYGLTTLLYGTLLPAPEIARRGADVLRAVRDAGFETGVHCHDHTAWQDLLDRRGPDWARGQMRMAAQRYAEVFGTPALTHGAAGWQMNEAALLEEEALGFDYATDARGSTPFVPWIAGRRGRVVQVPTTLPTLDELIGLDGRTAGNVHEALLALTASPRDGHVFTLHAELEGMKLMPVLARLLEGWRAQGYTFVSTRALYEGLDPQHLPACAVVAGTVPGRSGTLACQGAPVMA
jgi:undecaprenyl phosphate-alpha-L-ara4FN deformylase